MARVVHELLSSIFKDCQHMSLVTGVWHMHSEWKINIGAWNIVTAPWEKKTPAATRGTGHRAEKVTLNLAVYNKTMVWTRDFWATGNNYRDSRFDTEHSRNESQWHQTQAVSEIPQIPSFILET